MKRLSFSIAVNLLTENFKKGANTVKNQLRSIQMQIVTFAAALGAGGFGLMGLISRMKDVARETNRAITALKNVSGSTAQFADNLKFLNSLANKYGLGINILTGAYSKFTASATNAGVSIENQKKIFESVSRANAAFALSSDESSGVMLALSQMMGKGKISSEELRKQMGEKLPVAMAAMAKAAGTTIGGLEPLLKQGKLMAADILPKFADALNEMIPNVDTDNLETSLNRLSNVFNRLTESAGVGEKYKVIIDGLTGLIESASKNIQNIILGVVAAIVFVVTNGITKVWRSYQVVGTNIIASAEAANAKMVAATAARVEAEIALDRAKSAAFFATEKQRLQAAQAVAKAETTLKARVLAETKAIDTAKAASAQAAAIKTGGVWATTGAMIKGTFLKLGTAIKSMWNTFAPAIIISAIVAVVGYFKNMYDEAKRVKNIFKEYRKEAESVGNTQEVKMLQTQLAIMNDKTRSQKEINAAQATLQKMLGKEKLSQDEINKSVAKRIELLKAAAQADFYAQKAVEKEDVIRSRSTTLGISEDELKELARLKGTVSNVNTPNPEYDTYLNKLSGINSKNVTFKQVNKRKDIMNAVAETVEDLKVLADAEKYLKEASNVSNILTPTITPDDTKPDKTEDKRLEALRKLDEADRQRQLDKIAFDNEMRQKAIDNMDEGFLKEFAQLKLNHDRKLQEIEEYKKKMAKAQIDELKNQYVAKHGNTKGFESYLQTVNLSEVLPEGLKPEDISKQVKELTEAAKNAQRKGLADINKEFSAMLREQQLMFSSDLDKKLYDLDTYYNEQRIKAGNNADLINQIESNRKRAKQEVTINDKLQQLDFKEQLEIERAAGMESIGMTELVEEKKLEITKRYLQLRINALDKLAFAGDEEAFKQMQLLQASLKKLDTQKPVKSLKSLADKAIFDTIKKGFEKAGDSAEAAEEKTTSLLSSISHKASIVANITSELQSMFGGMDEGLDAAMETVGNIASGFAQGGIVGGAMAVIGEGMKLFSKASEAAARHQKALKEIADARLASQRAYNLLLREQNLLLEEAVSIFGEKQITRAANAIHNYRDSINDLRNEMQGDFKPDAAYEKALEKGASSGGIMGKFFGQQLNDYRKKVDNYNKGIAGLANATIVTGHKKTGLFGWGKGKDIYSSILDEYDDILDKEGKLNIARIQNILDTRKMSDETRNYLQNLVDLQDAAKAAQEELRNYLQSTFGVLGDDIMSSIENAILDKGVNAWEEFGKAGSKVIENLGKQLAYELFFAKKFAKLQEDLESIYGSGKSEEDIAREAMSLVGNFYQNIGKDMELAQGFMENWQKEAEKYGLSLWQSGQTQDSSKGYSVSMDQDTGGAILGRITGLHEVGLQMKDMLSGLSLSTNNVFTQTVFIGNELKKQTEILDEIKQIQSKSFFQMEEMGETLENAVNKLDKIDKNTKNL